MGNFKELPNMCVRAVGESWSTRSEPKQAQGNMHSVDKFMA